MFQPPFARRASVGEPGFLNAAEVQPMKSCLALLVFLAAALPASAQSPIRRSAPDFLFEKPHGAVTIRGSWLFSRGQSDWYDFVTDQLTLERQDFNAPGFGLDVSVPLTARLE